MWIAYKFKGSCGEWGYVHVPASWTDAEVDVFMSEFQDGVPEAEVGEFHKIDHPPQGWLKMEREETARKLRGLQNYTEVLAQCPTEEGVWMTQLVEKEKARILAKFKRHPERSQWRVNSPYQPERHVAEAQLAAEGEIRFDDDGLHMYLNSGSAEVPKG